MTKAEEREKRARREHEINLKHDLALPVKKEGLNPENSEK